jgi:drug/metabolite transporter (DMT)-like permease
MTRFYVIGFFVLMIFDTMAQIGFKLAAQHSMAPDSFNVGLIISWIGQVLGAHWIYFSVLGYLGAFITWMTLLKHAPIGPAFAASHLEIVSVLFISVFFMKESLSVVQVVGSLLILGGIFVLAAEEDNEQKKPQTKPDKDKTTLLDVVL